MTQVPYHISVKHGNMLINVPRNLFRGPDCEFVDDKVKEFRRIMSGRYPWLTENSLDVLLRNARNEMLRITDEETGAVPRARAWHPKGRPMLPSIISGNILRGILTMPIHGTPSVNSSVNQVTSKRDTKR